MALDEPVQTDNVFEVDGFKYVVNKSLLEKAQPIKVDYSGFGFQLDCALEFGAPACGSCSTTGSCCSDHG